MREQTQLKIIIGILESYQGKEPLSRFLKKYFNRNRQLGSRDRRLIQDFIYNYFRIGKMYSDKPVPERIAIANKICKAEVSPLLDFSFRDLANLDRLAKHIEPDKLFPFGRHLSDSIGKAEFIHSFLVQPKVWIRVRGEFSLQVEKELNEKNILFEKDPVVLNAWSVKQSTPLDQMESFQNGYFEIQDLSSQKTIQLIRPNKDETWWDVCAGAGGKSLLMAAYEPSIKLFCTDVRESALLNLKHRLQKSGFKNFSSNTVDLTAGKWHGIPLKIDGIIADVPCSGSGTWCRTPEWLTFFNPRSIEKFQDLQRKIVSGVVRFLPENKPFIYITCSVFKEENEENTAWMSANLPLEIQTQVYLEGAANGADTLFAARFVKT